MTTLEDLQAEINYTRQVLKPEGLVIEGLTAMHGLMQSFINYFEETMPKEPVKTVKKHLKEDVKKAKKGIREDKELIEKIARVHRK